MPEKVYVSTLIKRSTFTARHWTLLLCLLFMQTNTWSQGRMIQGIVRDTATHPIEGVIVLLAATNDTLVAKTDRIGFHNPSYHTIKKGIEYGYLGHIPFPVV